MGPKCQAPGGRGAVFPRGLAGEHHNLSPRGGALGSTPGPVPTMAISWARSQAATSAPLKCKARQSPGEQAQVWGGCRLASCRPLLRAGLSQKAPLFLSSHMEEGGCWPPRISLTVFPVFFPLQERKLRYRRWKLHREVEAHLAPSHSTVPCKTG